jgi:hypothetical protein
MSSYLDRANARMQAAYPDGQSIELANDVLESPENHPLIWLDEWEAMRSSERVNNGERVHGP